jgi:hypothetical protein
MCLSFLALSWLEKRTLDTTQNGYLWAQATIAMLMLCTPSTIYEAATPGGVKLSKSNVTENVARSRELFLAKSLAVVAKLLIFQMVVTGPATAATVLVFSIQAWMLYMLAGATGFFEVRSFAPPMPYLSWQDLLEFSFSKSFFLRYMI